MRTLHNTWQHALSLFSQSRTETGQPPRIAIVGLGNTLRADDAAGILVVRALSARLRAIENSILILEAGSVPENRTAELRAFAPDLVLFVDAAEMGEAPGAIRFIPEEHIDGMSASTHSLPLSMLACYLTLELGCKVILLGIQPASNEVGETISEPVSRAVLEVAEILEHTVLAVPTSTVYA